MQHEGFVVYKKATIEHLDELFLLSKKVVHSQKKRNKNKQLKLYFGPSSRALEYPSAHWAQIPGVVRGIFKLRLLQYEGPIVTIRKCKKHPRDCSCNGATLRIEGLNKSTAHNLCALLKTVAVPARVLRKRI